MKDLENNERLLLILGGSGSGKSSYAELRASAYSSVKKYYLATMQVYGEEGKAKVRRHRELRAGKGFVTIEKQKNISEAMEEIQGQDVLILLECMSNLVANEMFDNSESEEVKAEDAKAVADKICEQIAKLHMAVHTLIIVSNTVFEDGILYDESTRKYMDALGEINRRIADMADEVVELVAGIPIVVK